MVAERRPKVQEQKTKRRRHSDRASPRHIKSLVEEEEGALAAITQSTSIFTGASSCAARDGLDLCKAHLGRPPLELDMPSAHEQASALSPDTTSLSSSSATSSASSLSSMASFFPENAAQVDAVDAMAASLTLPHEVSLLDGALVEPPPCLSAGSADPHQGYQGYSPIGTLAGAGGQPPASSVGVGGVVGSSEDGPLLPTTLLDRGAVETRVHPRTARELEMVDESPPCLVDPRLDPSHPPSGPPLALSCGAAGRAKAFRGPCVEQAGGVTLYGEDAVVMGDLGLQMQMQMQMQMHPGLQHTPPDGDTWARMLAVFDGHGLMGKEAARIAADRLMAESALLIGEMSRGLLARDVEFVKAIERRKFQVLDAHLEQCLRSPTGGTTCSAVQLVRVQGRLFLVSSNVGDSPVLLVDNKTKKVRLISGRHSWDNPEERHKYLQRCASLGLPPREVVYGRINCGGMRMEDLRGGMDEPFLMYKPGTAIIDPAPRDHLCRQVEKRYKNSIGGSQSIRRFVMERRTFTGQWETAHALVEHGHVNWGATILVNREGKIQMSRSLGDLHEKQTAFIWAEPDVAIVEFSPDEDVTLIVCSDGISDLWYFHELGELASDFFSMQPEGDAQELADRILDLTLDRGAKTPGYGIGPRTGGLRKEDAVRRPGWDDVALQVIHLRVPQVPLPPPPQPLWGMQVEGTEAQPPPVPMEQGSSGSVEC